MEGTTTRYRRAQPFVPTAAEMAAFSGCETDDIGIMKITASGTTLSGTLAGGSPSVHARSSGYVHGHLSRW